MINKKELLTRPDYLLTKYQNEIYRQLVSYMEQNQLTQKDIAEQLGVSNAYVSQILNGNFNFTLKKLIELGLLIGKVPSIQFVDVADYWKQQPVEDVHKKLNSEIKRMKISPGRLRAK